MATLPRKKFLIKLTRRNADGQNVHRQRVTQSVQAVHPSERCRRTSFNVLSSASERPGTELFQCRCSLGVFVTEDSSVKTKRGKLSVEMTDQPASRHQVNDLPPNEVFFLRVRRPPWLRKHSFSTA